MPGNARTQTPGLVGAASRANSLADAQRHAVFCLGIRGARAPPLACAEKVTGCHSSRAASRAWCFVRTLDSPTPTAAGNAETQTGLWARLAGSDCARVAWRARTLAAACSAPHASSRLQFKNLVTVLTNVGPGLPLDHRRRHGCPSCCLVGAGSGERCAVERGVVAAIARSRGARGGRARLRPMRDWRFFA